ncbi:fimbrial protein [Enterobacter sp. H2G27]
MINYKQLKKLAAVFVLFISGLNVAYAKCTNTGAVTSATIVIPPVYDDVQTPVGATLGYFAIGASSSADNVMCTGDNTISITPMYTDHSMYDEQNHIVTTSVRGIGLQAVIEGGAYFTDNGSSKVIKTVDPLEKTNLHDVKKIFRVIKTGSIQHMPYESSLATIKIYAGTDASTSQATIFAGQVHILATYESPCYVDTSNISIPMGTVFAKTDFNGVNSTSKTVDFTIKMQCSGRLAIRGEIAATPESGYDNAIKITDTVNRASGIAVQIVRDGTPITLNTPFTVVDQIQQSVISLTLGARYVQTQQEITAGQANAVAVINFYYN